MFDCCGSGSVCCSRLRPEAHQKQPQKQPFPLRGEVGGAFSSQQWLFSGPGTRSSDLQRGTRQSKLLEILQTCRAPLGWQHSPPAQLGFERMTFVMVCGIFWSLHQKEKKLSEWRWLPRRTRRAWHAAGKHPRLCTGSSSGSPASRLDSFWLHLVSQGMDLPIVQFITGLALLIKVQEGG